MSTDAPQVPSQSLVGQIGADLIWLLREALRVGVVAFRFLFFLYAVPLMRSSNKEERFEGHGYFVWALALWTFAIPEVYGFAAGEQGRLPTLSSTVGNLINEHDWLSVFVVGLLFGCVLHVVRVQLPAQRQRRQRAQRTELAEGMTSGGQWTMLASESGRITKTQGDVELPVDARYEIVAIGLTVIAFVVPILANAGKQTVGECGYGVMLTMLFFVPGILAYRHDKLVPFPGLFTTVGFLERKSTAVALIVGGGLVFLALHLTFYPFPSILPDIQGLHHHCQTVQDPSLCVNPSP
jgi:hypothetical protein